MISRTLTLILLLGSTACRSGRRDSANDVVQARPTTDAADTTVRGMPRITALVPDSVRLAPNTLREIAIRGTGFVSAGRNTVRIGPMTLAQVPANAGGTEIRVVLPDRFTSGTGGPPRPLTPGDHAVTVQHPGGTSNAMMLKVMP